MGCAHCSVRKWLTVSLVNPSHTLTSPFPPSPPPPKKEPKQNKAKNETKQTYTVTGNGTCDLGVQNGAASSRDFLHRECCHCRCCCHKLVFLVVWRQLCLSSPLQFVPARLSILLQSAGLCWGAPPVPLTVCVSLLFSCMIFLLPPAHWQP